MQHSYLYNGKQLMTVTLSFQKAAFYADGDINYLNLNSNRWIYRKIYCSCNPSIIAQYSTLPLSTQRVLDFKEKTKLNKDTIRPLSSRADHISQAEQINDPSFQSQ